MGKCRNSQVWRTELIASLKVVEAVFPKDPYQMPNKALQALAQECGVQPPPLKPQVRGMIKKEKKYYDERT